MKVVKEAMVEIVKLKDLKVGDLILYSNLMCKIVKHPLHPLYPFSLIGFDRKVKVQQFPDDPESTMDIGPFRTYYKIKRVEMMDACMSCGEEIPEERDNKDMCEGCWAEQIMGSSVNPDNGEPWTEEEIRTELNMLRETEAGYNEYR